MKKMFDELREEINATIGVELFGEEYTGIKRVNRIINEAEAKWEAEEKEKPFTVGIDVHKQVMWERDTAIEQLHELGYELGEKPREAECCEWEHKRYHANCLCKCNDNHIFLDYDLVSSFRVCPYCGKPIKIVEVE